MEQKICGIKNMYLDYLKCAVEKSWIKITPEILRFCHFDDFPEVPKTLPSLWKESITNKFDRYFYRFSFLSNGDQTACLVYVVKRYVLLFASPYLCVTLNIKYLYCDGRGRIWKPNTLDAYMIKFITVAAKHNNILTYF